MSTSRSGFVTFVGRPNVGKSTLFNRLTRSRDAIVADLPGLTRDRHYGHGKLGRKPYLVVDTGGFEPLVKDGILSEMARQTEQAIAEADAVVFVVDAPVWHARLRLATRELVDAARSVGLDVAGLSVRTTLQPLRPQPPAVWESATSASAARRVPARYYRRSSS